MNLAEKLAAQHKAEQEESKNDGTTALPGQLDSADPNITTTEGGANDAAAEKARLEELEQLARQKESEAPTNSGIFTSHPIASLVIGPYHFEKGRLDLSAEPERAEKFRTLLTKMPPIERNRVREINQNAAERLVKAHMETLPGIDRTGDSGSARAAMQALQARHPKVGSTPIDVPNRTNGG